MQLRGQGGVGDLSLDGYGVEGFKVSDLPSNVSVVGSMFPRLDTQAYTPVLEHVMDYPHHGEGQTAQNSQCLV